MPNNKQNTEDLFVSLANTTKELVKLISSADSTKINTILSDSYRIRNSWTAAQVASHVTKSNKAIVQAMNMAGKKTGRNPGDRIQELKGMFLDYETKFRSPDFIMPTKDIYKKELLVTDLKDSIRKFKDAASVVDLTEIISLPSFGEITKLELAWFVLFHTQRHIQQLKKIFASLENKKNSIDKKLEK